MSVADKIAAELDDLHADETSPGMAAVALDLAKAIDASDAPTAKAVVADKLRPIMADLRKLAPVGEEGDALDELTRKREARRRGA
ncbi:hypothetical protein [Streptomyces himalayensis]|uniref:Terminase small subunit n=1 Tax=Streptomyces himalayensis subsp. himalayensis TaxID=2756131 RepID=A0A7W0DUQ4_9ACTN|nr:hypothetical protein [Streptomyces himalayensis]MBA2951597.1 hypothetical protein [Streptomyces himalayensis subsp. himalayensis]